MISSAPITLSTPQARAVRAPSPRDNLCLWLVAATATTTSGIWLWIGYRSGTILAHPDTITHLEIARRIGAGLDSGFAQLGSQWLPLPHLLIAPLASNDFLYLTGLAGAIVSGASYVLCCCLIYLIIRRTIPRVHAVSRFPADVAAATGTAVFALNPHILLLQSMPMPEMPLYAALLGTIHHLATWLENPDRRGALPLAAGCALLASLISYAAWVILPFLLTPVVWRSWRWAAGTSRRTRWRQLQDTTIVFGCIGFAGIIGWLGWRTVLFGAGLSPPWFNLTGGKASPRDLGAALFEFARGGLQHVPPSALTAAAAAVAVASRSAHRNPQHGGYGYVICAWSAAMAGFAWYSAVQPWPPGPQSTGMADERLGLVLVLPAAVLAGCFVGWLAALAGRPTKRVRVGLVFLACAVIIPCIGSVREPVVITPAPTAALGASTAREQEQVSRTLVSAYDGGDVLMELSGNEHIAFPPQVADAVVHEGVNNANRWQRALADPAGTGIRWIVMRCGTGHADTVCQKTLRRNHARLDAYDLRYIDPGESAHRIYRLREGE